MPNWVSNVIIVRPDDAKKLEAFFTVSKEDDQEILSFDFNKINSLLFFYLKYPKESVFR